MLHYFMVICLLMICEYSDFVIFSYGLLDRRVKEKKFNDISGHNSAILVVIEKKMLQKDKKGQCNIASKGNDHQHNLVYLNNI